MLENRKRTVENPEEKSKTDILKETLRVRSWVLDRLEEYAFELAPTSEVDCKFASYLKKVVDYELEAIEESISSAAVYSWLKRLDIDIKEVKKIKRQRNRELFEKLRRSKQDEKDKKEHSKRVEEEQEKEPGDVTGDLEERDAEIIYNETLRNEDWLKSKLTYFRDNLDNLKKIREAIIEKVKTRFERERISIDEKEISEVLDQEIGEHLIKRSELLEKTVNNTAWLTDKLKQFRESEGSIKEARERVEVLICEKIKEQGFRESCISRRYIRGKIDQGEEKLLSKKDAKIEALQEEFRTEIQEGVKEASQETIEKEFSGIRTEIKALFKKFNSLEDSMEQVLKSVICENLDSLKIWVLEQIKKDIAEEAKEDIKEKMSDFFIKLEDSIDENHSGVISKIKEFFRGSE